MSLLSRLWNTLYPDRRSEWEKKREREFIEAANRLKTLSVTDRGGMSIDPEEIRDQIIVSREQLKALVHRPPARVSCVPTSERVQNAAKDSGVTQVFIEVVTWRQLPSGGAVRYVCLQSSDTSRFAVVTAALFTEGNSGLPAWIDSDANRQIAETIQRSELTWHSSVIDAVDAWDAQL